MSAITTFIRTIITDIVNKNNNTLRDNLHRLPLSVISRGDTDQLISGFLNHATKSGNKDAVLIIIETFDNARIQVDPLPALVNLFLNPLISRDVLLFVVSCFPNKEPIDYFVDTVNMRDDDDALKIAGILTTFFPTMTNDDWNTLVKLTDDVEEEEYTNQQLRSYFKTKAAETGKEGSRPDWIRTDLSEPDTKDINKSLPELPTVADAVDMLLFQFKEHKIDVPDENNRNKYEEIKLTLISQYAISTIPEKIQMLEPAQKINSFDDKVWFQEFGPVNSIYTVNPHLLDSDHECVKYGGCRMLLCNEFEELATDGEEIDFMGVDYDTQISDWFRDSCDVCLKKISNRRYALRLPLCNGGWRGCYCSFECMKGLANDPQTALMVGRMQQQLKTIGIRDN